VTTPDTPASPDKAPAHRETPVMIAIGGLSGSGKTTLAYILSRHLPNTVVLDSDVLRKRMHGHHPLAPLPDAVYHPTLTAQFIDYARRTAAQHMAEGKNVIVTGLFTDAQSRAGQKATAENTGGDFIGIYLDIPAAKLFKRVASRRDNPSDARVDTLRKQIRGNPSQPGAGEGWHVLRADKGIDRTLQRALSVIRQQGVSPRAVARPWKPF
jgi:predicted kinase